MKYKNKRKEGIATLGSGGYYMRRKLEIDGKLLRRSYQGKNNNSVELYKKTKTIRINTKIWHYYGDQLKMASQGLRNVFKHRRLIE